jgi:hypothetical protein
VARIRASGALGRSGQLQRLFEFLVQCRAAGRVPKELEVAVDCFQRSSAADAAQDATVRVTAHKLRRRLEEYYRSLGEPPRLSIPRGEYRLALSEAAPPAGLDWRCWLPATRRERVAAAVAVLALLAGTLAVAWSLGLQRASGSLAGVRDSAIWAQVLGDDLPVQLVLGDYYIFGERNERGQVQRLVRDFRINSQQELQRGFLSDPALAERYEDLALGYLPTSSAQALHAVLPVLVAAGKPVMLTLSSELDPATLKSTHVVYLGYLSGLGMLEDMVLSGSRYSLGGSYDELIDSLSGAARVSEAGEPHPPGSRYRDYAYLAAFNGPGGHAHLVLAGMRDVGLMQAAELVAEPGRLRELEAQLPGRGPFEALYEVQGLNGINVDARLLEAAAMASGALSAPP